MATQRRNPRPLTLLAGLLLWFAGLNAAWGQLAISNVTAVDVRPSGFTVIWEASQASTPGIRIYSDAAGTLEITDQLEVTPFPLQGGDPAAADKAAALAARQALRDTARGLGLMSIRVDGANPGTSYFYQVSSSTTLETALAPLEAPAAVVTTAENSFLSGSQQALVTFGVPDARGWLVTAATAETLHPVSAYVGDGAGPNQAFLNLSQLFEAPATNWNPSGPKLVTIRVRRSATDIGESTFTVSFDANFSVATVQDLAFGAPAPLITLLEPAQNRYTTGQNIQISWSDEFPNTGATISLFFDTDAVGEDGVLIAGALPEEPDGAADQFDWDTTGVPDGAYFVYASVTDGTTSDVSYSTGRVTIDRNQVDGDLDQMSDLWEDFHFATLARNGLGDADADGNRDAGEYRDQTDPNTPDYLLALQPGLNLVSFPIELQPARDSGAFLTEFGGTISAISRVDPVGNIIQTTTFDGTTVGGTVFALDHSEGYYLQLSSDAAAILSGAAIAPQRALAAGNNFQGFSEVPDGYDAYQLLQAIGDATVVASVARYNPATGRFEAAVYQGATPGGINFPIERGRAYLIGMHAAVSGFAP